jgi:L-serine dehydratase
MRAAREFVSELDRAGELARVHRLSTDLYGSLALTGKGHGTDRAIILGLLGEKPDEVDPNSVDTKIEHVRSSKELILAGKHKIAFHELNDLRFLTKQTLPGHSNTMRFTAFDSAGTVIDTQIYYSVGGGFIQRETSEAGAPSSSVGAPSSPSFGEGGVVDSATPSSPVGAPSSPPFGEGGVVDSAAPSSSVGAPSSPSVDNAGNHRPSVPYPFRSADDLLSIGERTGLAIWQIALENEKAWRPESEIRAYIDKVWHTMQACLNRGLQTEGILPGGLKVRRRAPALARKLAARSAHDPLTPLDWVNAFAMAVNEENAAGGRVVTAPTNGAAGIIPAVGEYYSRFIDTASHEGIVRYLLTACAIGILYKENASISGAEVGCQGEVGVACSMAAGGLVAAQGGTNLQVEYAAEIGMEHNLGMTCDPIGGLVQIPCIERNAMGSVKAINAARIAMQEGGEHKVSLDQVIKTMYQTGLDMQSRYKETSLAGLALNVIEC